MSKYLLIFCCLLLLAGCASKRFTKKAGKFEEAGLYKDAAEFYYEAVKKKASNVDAKLGLMKNGQLTLDNKIETFTNYYQQANYQEAVYSFLQAEKYYNKIRAVGVDLEFPAEARVYYEESKSDYLGNQYLKGSELLDREEFSEALRIFSEIKKVDENYKDVKDKYIIARFEPKYREAIKLYEDEKFRKAYYTFEYILNETVNYKQAFVLKDECQKKATITIIVSDFNYSHKQQSSLAEFLSNNLRKEINQLDNPFLKLADPQSIEVPIFRYRGEVDMKAAEMAGIFAVIFAEVNDFNKYESKLSKTTKKGYLKEVVKIKNSEGVETEKVTYHKTEYSEFGANSEASINISYKMVATNNGELLISDAFSRKKTDEVHYAIYEGENKNLVPGYWKYKERGSAEDVVKDEKKEVRQLKNLLDARKELKSGTDMLNELIVQAISSISTKVDHFNPEKE
ncbi:MAG: hypothetical protein K9G76_08530 [Bacteroidales bacterium]|nr:hypothetical protein [Bacteroidales bacterium]MCF8404411.1 hypothetical protein [Bacteroidales bacterium]